MTKQRRRLLMLMAVVAALALPGVHWRLIGWARGEPFWRGRPASYWRDEIMSCEAYAVYSSGDYVLVDSPRPPPSLVLTRDTGPVGEAVRRLVDYVNMPDLIDPFTTPLSDCDFSAVPVLMVLLGDPNPKVRYCAVQALGGLGERGRPALPFLLGMTNDRAEVCKGVAVADAVPYALWRIDPEAWKAAGSH